MSPAPTIACPQCGSSVDVDRRFSHMAVCGACRSVVTFGEDAARVAGKLSVLPPARSPLYVGAEGTVGTRRLTVLGRVRYGYDRGYWDEWYALLDSGEPAWLSEDEGELSFEHPVPLSGAEIVWKELRPGASVTAGDREWHVSERGVAKCEGGEGQLPFVIIQGEEIPFADLDAASGSGVATLELDPTDGTRMFRGQVIPPGGLTLDRPRDDGARAWDVAVARKAGAGVPERLTMLSGAVRAVSCRSCGGGMEVDVREGVPERIRCPYCDNVEALGPRAIECPSCQATVNVRSGDEAGVVSCQKCKALVNLRTSSPSVLTHLAGKARRPPLRLGQTVNLRGVKYEATGWLHYDGRSSGEAFEWDEILLFSDKAGYRWLELSDGHASLGRKIYDGPRIKSPAAAGDSVPYGGASYRVAERGVGHVVWVEGELPWVATVGDRVETLEAARPPFLLSGEWSESELEWYLAEYVPRAELLRALDGPSDLPRVEGVAPHQPYPMGLKALLALSVLFLVIALVGAGFAATLGKPVANLTFGADAYDEGQLGEPFLVSKSPTTLELDFQSPVDNAWVFARCVLLDGDGQLVQDFTSQISYYHGVEGGESWSEGSTSDTAFVRLEKAGKYQIGIEAEAGRGNSEAEEPGFEPTITVAVEEGAMPLRYLLVYAGVCFVLAIGVGVHRLSFRKRQLGLEDDDDD